MSASESSCFPNSDWADNDRAANPSRKSNNTAIKIRYTAQSICPFEANAKLMHPHRILRLVRVFGICFFIDMWSQNRDKTRNLFAKVGF